MKTQAVKQFERRFKDAYKAYRRGGITADEIASTIGTVFAAQSHDVIGNVREREGRQYETIYCGRSFGYAVPRR